ncbi:hypothetical protein AAG747_25035 [Rapidithrix thailandica]|uniref:Uncharacterized protein n=1 Tax=Rapidithrix thailandica TaxID=413964 RepID=A0AAW9S4U0_9BACT
MSNDITQHQYKRKNKHMLLRIKSLHLFGFMFICCLLSCGGEKRFSARVPYAIEIHRYRLYQQAEKAQKRLTEMEINAYLIASETEDEGRWYHLVAGAEKDLETMMSQKIVLEDKHGLQDIRIVNFNKLSSNMVEMGEVPQEQVATVAPNLPEAGKQLLEKLPYLSEYHLRSFTLLMQPDSISILSFPSVRDLFLDLPRGIAPKELWTMGSSLAEVVYEDALMGRKLTVHALKTSPEKVTHENLMEYFAQVILDTRVYEFEEKLPVESGSFATLKGYLVNITPRPDQLKRYLLLMDPAQEYVFFIQDSGESDKVMREVSESFGKENLKHYLEFNNTFQMLPETAMNSSLLVSKIQFIDGGSNRHFRRFRGHYEAKFRFYQPGNGLWKLSFGWMNNPVVSQRYFDYKYAGVKAQQTDTLHLYGQNALLHYAKTRDAKSRKYSMQPRRLQFCTDLYAGEYYQHVGIDKETLEKEVAEFQFGKGFRKTGFFAGWLSGDF